MDEGRKTFINQVKETIIIVSYKFSKIASRYVCNHILERDYMGIHYREKILQS